MEDRRTIDFGDLDDFDLSPKKTDQVKPVAQVKSRSIENELTQRAVDRSSSFPSREQSTEGQLNIRAPNPVLDRFRAMAKQDRYTLGAFLEILMNKYEQP